mmetsp:Transcript_22791/g.48435  ORF Transcript_22791/g.48435 Transcript_22791/m.48435 type:complete len:318 (-) Transcript_22791:402-1355(-)
MYRVDGTRLVLGHPFLFHWQPLLDGCSIRPRKRMVESSFLSPRPAPPHLIHPVFRLQYSVQVRSAIPEETPCQARRSVLLRIDRRSNHRNRIIAVHLGLCHLGSCLVRDEGSAVKGDALFLRGSVLPEQDFGSVSIAGHHRHHVCRRVALHDPLPVIGGIDGGVLWLGPDGGRIQQDVGSLERHGPGGLREPLVPADGHPDLAHAGLPHLEPGVAGAEIKLFLVPGPVRDVGFPVDSGKDRPVGVDHHDGVVEGVVPALEEGYRQDDSVFLSEALHRSDQEIEIAAVVAVVVVVGWFCFPRTASVRNCRQWLVGCNL